jgi:hypothetical protein
MAQRLPPGLPAGRRHHRAVILRSLPLHLAESARTWLEHLPPSQIHSWDDLVRTFVGNFQGTYVHPLPDSRALLCTGGARQRLEYARHSLCRAHFAQAHDKGRTTHFYPAKTFAVHLGERQRHRKGVDGRPRGDGVTPSLPCATEHARERW